MHIQVDANSGEIGGLLGIWKCWVAHEALLVAADGMIGVAVKCHPSMSIPMYQSGDGAGNTDLG